MKKLSLLLTCVMYANFLFAQHTTEKKSGYTLTTITKKDIGEIKVFLPEDVKNSQTKGFS